MLDQMPSEVFSLLPALAVVFDEIEHPLLVTDRAGRLLYANPEAQDLLWDDGPEKAARPAFVGEILGTELEDVLRALEAGASSFAVECLGAGGLIPARVRRLPKSDWLLIQMSPAAEREYEPRPTRLREDFRDGLASSLTNHNGNKVTLVEASGNTEDRSVCDDVGEGLYFFAASPVMKKIRKQMLRIASVNVPVLITGESGSGKEVIARLIHSRCAGRSGPFVKVNCAALPGELLESELFGYEQGAFTGAGRAKPGKFEFANHGTIFLDEIAEMSTHLQSKLLHVLQDGRFSRLGARQVTQVDVRVIAATNVGVHEAIRQGQFREDLYYRLNVVPCHLPPLRQRTEEIPMLFRLFLDRYRKEFGEDAPEPSARMIDAALAYPWPGNVRELENFVKRYVILASEEDSLRDLLDGTASRQDVSEPGSNGHRPQNMKSLVRGLKDEAETKAIGEALRQTNWRRKDTARILGISYKALLYKMRQFGFSSAANPVAGERQGAERGLRETTVAN
ncbi:MAG TPA: sigma 54-interacting transcriptional regulator [Patescibacteria group bacterium]|nr:sigma 54-interacting transcriptional regulator [Patescibacteria group bacterium]